MKAVIIYSQETCPPCHAEKLWLKENGIAFEERDIRKNDQFLHELIALGAAATPVTVLKDQDSEEVIMGFDQSKLAELLGLKKTANSDCHCSPAHLSNKITA